MTMAIDWLPLAAAALAGLLGGAHCAAMCGGIATSFGALGGRTQALANALQANAGRIVGYALAGATVGTMGHGLIGMARMPMLLVGLRVALGLAMILLAIRLLARGRREGLLGKPAQMVWRWLQPLQRRAWPPTTPSRRLALAVLWGWMPCGLSTSILAIAWLQADALQSTLTMLAFGFGTLPVMLPLTWSGARLGHWLQGGQRRVAASALLMLAGAVTAVSPWLMQVPALHGVLGALGCVRMPV